MSQQERTDRNDAAERAESLAASDRTWTPDQHSTVWREIKAAVRGYFAPLGWLVRKLAR